MALPEGLWARHLGDGSGADKPVRKIDLQEGKARIEHFRNQRLEGDFSLKFELRHIPRRQDPIIYQGVMWGSWNEAGPIFRVQVWPQNIGHRGLVEYIIQSGPHPRVWRKDKDHSISELDKQAMLEPMFEGVLYGPYDLVMPFAYWEDFEYEGSGRVKGRPAYTFLMKPPEALLKEMPSLGPVRIVLDGHFNALLKAEWLDANKTRQRLFKMLNFKKVADQWIVKTIDLVDYKTRDKTRFDVVEAALNLQLNVQNYFTAQSLNAMPPPVTEGFYDPL